MKEKTVNVREMKGEGREVDRVATGWCEEAIEERRKNGCMNMCGGEKGCGQQELE